MQQHKWPKLQAVCIQHSTQLQVLSAIVFFRIIRVSCAYLDMIRVLYFNSFNQKEISLTNLIITQTTTIPAKSTQNAENPFFNHIRNLQTTFSSKFITQIGDPAVLNSLNINDTHLKQQQQLKSETQTTETLWTLPTNNSVPVKSQHHATSHFYWNELVKLHHLTLPAAPNKSTTIDLCGLVLERQKERDKRDSERRNNKLFF